MNRPTLVSIREGTMKGKKYKALFTNGKVVHFGQRGARDYTFPDVTDEVKDAYLKRHKKNENWNNPYSAGSLSRWVLWNKKSLKDSIADYKKKFKV